MSVAAESANGRPESMDSKPKKHGVPPGPPVPWPLQYGVAGLEVLRGGDLSALRLVQRVYGDLFSVPMPFVARWFTPDNVRFKKVVFVGSPELIKQVLADGGKALHFGTQSPLGTVLGRNSLLALDGPRHKEQRKLVMPPFHGERMHHYEAIVEEETLRETASWPHGRQFRTLEPMMRVTLRVILRAIFGARPGPIMDELLEDAPKAVKLGSRLAGIKPIQRDLGPWSPWGRFLRYRRRFQWGVNALVEEARNDSGLSERTDVLALFAQAHHEDDGSPMTDEEIADQLATVMAAGHETTATTLAWAFDRLSRHPDVLERLVAEADQGGDEYRRATINELQRTRPVVPGTGRYTVKPFELGDYVLPVGTVLLLATPLLHNDPEVYPEPKRFNPDRFVGARPSPHSWLPFGGGIHRCPGASFAQMEMDIALRTILRRFEIKTTNDRGERFQFRGVAFAPAEGGLVSVRPRTPRSLPEAERELAEAAV